MVFAVEFQKNFRDFGISRFSTPSDFELTKKPKSLRVHQKMIKLELFIVLFNILTLKNFRLSWQRNNSRALIG